ncbi:MAG: acetyl-CoA carboxylase biotin carboxyl carrier protein subunit [Alphaproteobacteria bacterium]|nr:acetyl-CoA carboxylase biotin carboxyl carrier protein subunit [Alphaproteobacteria bacterium]
MASNEIDEDLVRRLAALLEETGLSEIEYGTDAWRVRVVKQRAEVMVPVQNTGTATAEPGAAPSAGPDQAAEPGAITSPMVGTVYLAPEPGAPPFVKAGDHVDQGQTLLLIEAMKTFNEIRAPHAGEVAELLVQDKMPVEYGDVLLILR